jgi:hypothetical protein
MDADGTKSKADRKLGAARPLLFDSIGGGELLWQPHRLLSHALLQTHQNLSAFTAVNRALADDLQAIARRSHDVAIEVSEKAAGRGSLPLKADTDVEAVYALAISGVRELGAATVEAQI